MTLYTNQTNAIFGLPGVDDEFVNGTCTVCHKPRRECAESRNDPYTEINEQENANA